MVLPVQTGLVVAVFSSDKGPGDPERSTLMSEFGRVFAKHGAQIVCLCENEALPVPLITAARAAGGSATVLADTDLALPSALQDLSIEVVPETGQRLARLTSVADVLVGLPGSLASVTALFGAWKTGGLPVVLLNRHKAFEVIRGFSTDVLAASVPGFERKLQFADTVEDAWNKVAMLALRR